MHTPSDPPASANLESGFRLGPLRIKPNAGEAAGPGGTEKLDPKVTDVLVMLAQNAGQVVLRTDLLERLWPHVVVTDEVLSRCIYELRRQLSQAAGDEQFKDVIETLPKRGYRLNGDVVPESTGSAVRRRPARSTWIIASVLAFAAAIAVGLWIRGSRETPTTATGQPSIAVLPFDDMSVEQDQAYFSDGVTEEILNRLAQSKDLRVISRTSSFALRDQSLGVSAIAGKLGVTHVLEGSVRKSGDRIRVTAQLIAASDSSHLWSQSFERGFSDIFSIQDEIAVAVATALEVTLADGAQSESMPASVEAYENYLKGEFFYGRRSPGDVERSVGYLKDAVALDPNFGRAWAILAAAYSWLAWNGPDVDERLQRLQGQAAQRAVEVDPGLAIAHLRLAQFYSETGENDKAAEHHRIAEELDPNEPMVLVGVSDLAFEQGDAERAIAIRRRLVAHDPLNRVTRQNFAMLLLAAGKLDEAMSEYLAVLELSPDAGLDIEIELVRIHVLQGREAEAFAAVTRMPPGKYRDHGLALLYRSSQHRAEADAALARLLAAGSDASGTVQQGVMDQVRVAEVQAFRGMNDEAFATLELYRDALNQKWSDVSVAWYFQHEAELSPFLKPLHGDPRWSSFMEGHL